MSTDDQPTVVDLFCGLGGWAEGFLAEGYRVIGFDIEHRPYPGQLVLQDILTVGGQQLARLPNLRALVASPPCQEFSYMAMPWKRGKQIAAALRGNVAFPEEYTGSRSIEALTALFDACFRIQREASEALGREIPMVVENVKGAQPWVGKARANFGSFYLWGDVESIGGRIVRRGPLVFGMPTVKAAARQMKMGRAPKAQNGVTRRLTNPDEWREDDTREFDGRKQPGIKLSEVGFNVAMARQVDPNLKPDDFVRTAEMKRQHIGFTRNQASAQIAKIPFPLANHIARVFKP